MDITYTKSGDYYLPNIVLSNTTHYHIGKYGRMRRDFLKEHRPIQYSDLILTEKLFPHLAEIDDACHQRLAVMIPAMVEREGVAAALKKADQIEWVRRMNSIKARAEEVILAELIYTD
ncbi:MAG: TnpV protein [Clostridiales bacterium]|nr:TnpV protein [Clostridiales bacterium]